MFIIGRYSYKAWFPYDRPDRPSRLKTFEMIRTTGTIGGLHVIVRVPQRQETRGVISDFSGSDNIIFVWVSQTSQTYM